MVDAASGDVLVEKTLATAKELIVNMTSNSQQFGTRSNNGAVYHVQASSSKLNFPVSSDANQQILTNKLDELESFVRQLVVSQTAQVSAVSPQPRVYGICYDVSHPTDVCPTLQEENFNNHIVAAAGVFLGRPQQ